MPDNAILVGPARSGTTLVCSLLNQLPDVVALDEPFDRSVLQQMRSPEELIALIGEEFQRQRELIRTRGEAHSTVVEAGVMDNHYSTQPSLLRRRQVGLGKIPVNASNGFKLILKHTLPFTAVVDELLSRYRAYALVRNPLGILASWSSIDAAYRDGEIQPYVAALTGDLSARLGRNRDKMDRQIDLLQWHFERYLPLLRAGAVQRYEDIVETGGRALEIIAPSARRLKEDLVSHNTNPLYDPAVVDQLLERLLASRGAIWDFYTRSEVEKLVADFDRGSAAE